MTELKEYWIIRKEIKKERGILTDDMLTAMEEKAYERFGAPIIRSWMQDYIGESQEYRYWYTFVEEHGVAFILQNGGDIAHNVIPEDILPEDRMYYPEKVMRQITSKHWNKNK
jgi:hypothetical protein